MDVRDLQALLGLAYSQVAATSLYEGMVRKHIQPCLENGKSASVAFFCLKDLPNAVHYVVLS